MPASHILSYEARRRALLSSSYSPKLPDASQFPISAILAKLPLLPDDPILDAPGQLALPTPPTPPTPAIDIDLPQPRAQVAGDSLLPAFKTVPLPPDDDEDEHLKANKKERLLDSRPIAWWTRFDLDDGLKLKPDKNSKRFLGSRSIAWWTRFRTSGAEPRA